MMEPCNSLDKLLQHVDPSTVQGYKKLMQEVIIQGICYHNLNFETLNHYLLHYNEELYDKLSENAFSYFDMNATSEMKSRGI